MMVAVVDAGTGRQAAIDGYTVAGKTGTARKPQANGTYQDGAGNYHYVTTFAGFVPAEDPQLSIIVVIDEPSNGYYASQVAAPGVRRPRPVRPAPVPHPAAGRAVRLVGAGAHRRRGADRRPGDRSRRGDLRARRGRRRPAHRRRRPRRRRRRRPTTSTTSMPTSTAPAPPDTG